MPDSGLQVILPVLLGKDIIWIVSDSQKKHYHVICNSVIVPDYTVDK